MNYHKPLSLFITLTIFGVGYVYASTLGDCKTTASLATKNGDISKTICGDSDSTYKEFINIDGNPVLTDKHLYREGRNSEKTISIYSGDTINTETWCNDEIYLVDSSLRPVKVIAFGVKNACNEFKSAKWEKDRVVITLKESAIFIYKDGRMILPPGGKGLWDAIEAPNGGKGLSEADAIPFSKLLTPPKKELPKG